MKKTVLITSGGTREHIDDFRLITNISSGNLGAVVADTFYETGDFYYYATKPDDIFWDVKFLHTRYSKMPKCYCLNKPSTRFTSIQVESANDALEALRVLIPTSDVVVHAMAVADFGFKKTEDIKLKSNDPEALINYMKERIVVNPKLISYFKEWNPNIMIFGFKFEINKSLEDLINIAYDSLTRNNSNFVIANDKAEMKREKNHIAYIIDKNKTYRKLFGKKEIANAIVLEANKFLKESKI